MLPTTSCTCVNAVPERSSHSHKHRWRYRSTSDSYSMFEVFSTVDRSLVDTLFDHSP
jgi:hypothetical protein